LFFLFNLFLFLSSFYIKYVQNVLLKCYFLLEYHIKKLNYTIQNTILTICLFNLVYTHTSTLNICHEKNSYPPKLLYRHLAKSYNFSLEDLMIESLKGTIKFRKRKATFYIRLPFWR
jgi:hypothetical protein